MKFAHQSAITAFLLFFALFQSGCLSGLAFWPLWIVGSGTSLIGFEITAKAIREQDSILGLVSLGTMTAGGILDSENPGRNEGFNELPLDEDIAKKVNVSFSEIKSFNRELDKIHQVAMEMVHDFRSQILRMDLKEVSTLERLFRDPEIHRLLIKYGFENAEDFLSSIHKKAFPALNLKNFAKNMDLTQGQAKLLLYYGFGIQLENE